MKRYQFPTLVLLSLILLGTTALGASASTKGEQAAKAAPVTSPGKPVTLAAAAPQVVNMQKVPKETSAQAAANAQRQPLPLGTGVSPAVYAKRKAAAAHSQVAPKPGTAPMTPPSRSSSAAPQTPQPIILFPGMADSAATCAWSECYVPDTALAVSFSQVVQGVNASIAVYTLGGTLQPGWPKTAQSFFGVPNPGSCDPNGPFLFSPRAFYDQNFNRFWVAMVQIEGAILGDTCANDSTLWIAVSQTGNATGAWNIYHISTSSDGGWADFLALGFDQQAIYVSYNIFSFKDLSFMYAMYYGLNKFNMMNGKSLFFTAFLHPTLNGVPLDTVQPTLGEALQVGGPLSGQFIASENLNFGGGECSTSVCSGVVIITMSNPASTSATSSMLFVPTNGYSLAPFADQPGCTACVDTFDTRITGMPTWHNGLITFALNAAVNNGSQIVPGIFWGQIMVNLNADGSLSGAEVFQQGYYYFDGDGAAMYGALGTDGDGDIFMVYNFSRSADYPSLDYTSRRVTYALGTFQDGLIMESGAASSTPGEVGFYNALSPSGVPFTDDIWFSGGYANANGAWSTEIAHVKFVKGQS